MAEKSKSRSVQTFGYVYHDTNGLNHGPVWKIQSFLLNGICTVLWQDYCGKGNLRKSYWSTVGKKLLIGNPNSCTENREKGLFLSVYVDESKLALKVTSSEQTR